MTLIAARGLTAEWLSDELGRRIGALDAACPPGRRVVGIEHEYAVFRGKAQLDFASIVHDLGIPGERLHPTNGDMYLTASGSAVMADGLVAEIATPPVEIAPGFTRALQGSLTTTGHLLGAALTDGDRLEGGSTHISVQIDHTAADRAAARFARTYAAPLMLLMDRAHSPGLLVRPRPGRLEFGG
ncbi:MAG TPA: hypothetical protein VLA10_05395, partial [Ilumatobacter sp.]|nr:hypothetical protein [Ilumatobacter sp.]